MFQAADEDLLYYPSLSRSRIKISRSVSRKSAKRFPARPNIGRFIRQGIIWLYGRLFFFYGKSSSGEISVKIRTRRRRRNSSTKTCKKKIRPLYSVLKVCQYGSFESFHGETNNSRKRYANSKFRR